MEKVTKKKGSKKNNVILIIAVAAVLGFGGAFAYFAYDYFLWWRDGHTAAANTRDTLEVFADQMQDISNALAAADAVDGAYIADVVGEVAAHVSFTAMSAAFDTSPLARERERTGNPDIVAFLYIQGTNVNNVVVQGPDNSFYLYRDAMRNRNVNGALFLDFRNSPLFTDKNTIIYGHNMNNGTMFHDLRFYLREDFFESHPYITVIMDDMALVYQIFSVFQTRIDFDYIQVDFEDRDEFGELVAEIMRRRVFDTGVVATADDNMLILSTCTNVTEDTRIVVAARLSQVVLIRE